MSFEVVYTPRAKSTLNTVWNFINENWGEKHANIFLERADKIILRLTNQPFMF